LLLIDIVIKVITWDDLIPELIRRENHVQANKHQFLVLDIFVSVFFVEYCLRIPSFDGRASDTIDELTQTYMVVFTIDHQGLFQGLWRLPPFPVGVVSTISVVSLSRSR
jgi:hypothetical protein